MALGAYDSNWVSGDAWLGMDLRVGVHLASIVDLVADIKDAEAEGVRWTEGFRDRGFAIEQRIRKMDFSKSAGDAGVGEPPIGVVLGDLWKAVSRLKSVWYCTHPCADDVDSAISIRFWIRPATSPPTPSARGNAQNAQHLIPAFLPLPTTVTPAALVWLPLVSRLFRRYARRHDRGSAVDATDDGAPRSRASVEG